MLSGKAGKHQADHGELDHRFATLGQPLLVFGQTTVAIEPPKGSLNLQRRGSTLNPLRLRVALDDFEHTMAGRFDPGNQLTSVSPVRPDMNKSGQTPRYLFQHQLGPVSILD